MTNDGFITRAQALAQLKAMLAPEATLVPGMFARYDLGHGGFHLEALGDTSTALILRWKGAEGCAEAFLAGRSAGDVDDDYLRKILAHYEEQVQLYVTGRHPIRTGMPDPILFRNNLCLEILPVNQIN
jgi:hypothetical protein